ncbi:MAG TPA: YggS family pyridoxal phosphate-dependent enzyme [Acidobacteriota bacterium]|nr:YggS family pyridoxal phosphate-dependent enzyme [Acidobacteriota bacterium]
MNSSIRDNLRRLRDDIRETAVEAGRPLDAVRLLAISKTFSPQAIRQAVDAGQLLFGENRIQEAEPKIPLFRKDRVEWHLVGHLQSNKARQAVELFDVIQSVDSEKIARRIARFQPPQNGRLGVFIQVNIGEEDQKFGLPPEEAARLVETVDDLGSLELLGLMAIPPFTENAKESRPYFQRMARLLGEINRARSSPLLELSMGMSADYRVAIQEGSTMVRIGTALFGSRSG